jgi:hypothetical protein
VSSGVVIDNRDSTRVVIADAASLADQSDRPVRAGVPV